jgi:uncharacterized protein YeaO (DUF488 family)
MIRLKRIYSKPDSQDGYRILIDQLWPRNIKKDEAKIDLWFKEIAPRNGLRKWFSHEPSKWESFQTRYKKELGEKSVLIEQLL